MSFMTRMVAIAVVAIVGLFASVEAEAGHRRGNRGGNDQVFIIRGGSRRAPRRVVPLRVFVPRAAIDDGCFDGGGVGGADQTFFFESRSLRRY